MINTANTPVLRAMRKAELMEVFKDYPQRQRRREIIEVIVEIRQVSLKEAQDVKTLKPREVEEVYKRLS